MSVHVMIQAWPQGSLETDSTTVSGSARTGLPIEPADLTDCLPVSFDDVLEQLQQWPRMFAEPDGSWVWVGEHASNHWQLDGQLHDGPTGLLAMEVKGQAPVACWEALLRTLEWPDRPLLFQFLREGFYLDEQRFWAHLQTAQE